MQHSLHMQTASKPGGSAGTLGLEFVPSRTHHTSTHALQVVEKNGKVRQLQECNKQVVQANTA